MNLEEKAQKLLIEGRLQIERVTPDTGVIVASCRGLSQGEIYKLGYDPRPGPRGWRCTCEASSKFGRRCSHIAALQLVVVRPQREDAGNG